MPHGRDCQIWGPSAPHAAACSWLNAVDEIDTFDDLGAVREAAQFALAFFGVLTEFAHHVGQVQ